MKFECLPLTVVEPVAPMKIYRHLRADHIFLNVPLKDKDEVIHFVADTFARLGLVTHAPLLYGSLIERENTLSTGIGNGIGIPHAVSGEALDSSVLLIRLAHGIDFEALDRLPVDIILALLVPENRTHLHLQILAGISRLCKRAEFMDFVRRTHNAKDLWQGIKRIEDEIAFH
jgi:mannitol/fructose-specific phosphotransferase system IIA component (Ntr-type)